MFLKPAASLAPEAAAVALEAARRRLELPALDELLGLVVGDPAGVAQAGDRAGAVSVVDAGWIRSA